jgi:hypothetical protein
LNIDVELQRAQDTGHRTEREWRVRRERKLIANQIIELPRRLLQNHFRDCSVPKVMSESETEESGPKAPEIGIGMVLVDRRDITPLVLTSLTIIKTYTTITRGETFTRDSRPMIDGRRSFRLWIPNFFSIGF